VAGNWQFPKSFSQIHGHEFSQLLAATLALMSTDIQLVSINLDREQFIEEAYICELGRVQEAYPQIQVVVELTEHDGKVTNRQLIDAAARYVQSRIWICLDDVGTGDNQISLCNKLIRTSVSTNLPCKTFMVKKTMRRVSARIFSFGVSRQPCTTNFSPLKDLKMRLISKLRKTIMLILNKGTTLVDHTKSQRSQRYWWQITNLMN
jgi:FOG: EAL domain